MIDQLNRILGELSRLEAEANLIIDGYVVHIRERDDLGAIPHDCIRQTQIDTRARQSMDMRRALELIREDIGGAKAAPTCHPVAGSSG